MRKCIYLINSIDKEIAETDVADGGLHGSQSQQGCLGVELHLDGLGSCLFVFSKKVCF